MGGGHTRRTKSPNADDAAGNRRAAPDREPGAADAALDAPVASPNEPGADDSRKPGDEAPIEDAESANTPRAEDDPALTPRKDAPAHGPARGREEDALIDGPSASQEKAPVTPPEDSNESDGRENVPVAEADAARTATGETRAYRVVKTRQSANSVAAEALVDGDPTTSWGTVPGAALRDANAVLDLGKSRSIRGVRWLVAPDGLAGEMQVAVSPDGKRWKSVAGEQQASGGTWQELRLNRAVDARYVRLSFTNPTGEPRLGGLAEVEVWAGVNAEAKGVGARDERHRDKPGRDKAKPGRDKAKPGRDRASPDNKRVKSGKHHKKAKAGNGKNRKKGKSGGNHRHRARH
jgi:hypothetical protein